MEKSESLSPLICQKTLISPFHKINILYLNSSKDFIRQTTSVFCLIFCLLMVNSKQYWNSVKSYEAWSSKHWLAKVIWYGCTQSSLFCTLCAFVASILVVLIHTAHAQIPCDLILFSYSPAPNGNKFCCFEDCQWLRVWRDQMVGTNRM